MKPLCSLFGTTNCNAIAGGALRRHKRPSELIDKLPNCKCHERRSGDSPAQSDQDGGAPVQTNSRTVESVLSIRDAVMFRPGWW